MNQITFGAEIEWGDIDRTKQLPPGFNWDLKEVTIMNSNGIAVDGKGKYWQRGGELLTPPAESVAELARYFRQLVDLFPEAHLTHRNGLHIHIRLPGLRDDLSQLKSLQTYIHKVLPAVLPILEPLVDPGPCSYPNKEDHALARWHMQRMRRSHQTFLTEHRLEKQISARTVEEFFSWEAPQTEDGRPQHHLQPRCCVNLRQLLQTDTIEFRHFYSTLDTEEFVAAAHWCLLFIESWRNNRPVTASEAASFARLIPKGNPPFCPVREARFRVTCWDGSVDKKQARAVALAIEAEHPLPDDKKY